MRWIIVLFIITGVALFVGVAASKPTISPDLSALEARVAALEIENDQQAAQIATLRGEVDELLAWYALRDEDEPTPTPTPTDPPVTDDAVYVAVTGDDATGDGTAASPWRTIQQAASTVPGGATVYVQAGTYNERVAIPASASGAADAPTKFIADGDVVVAQGFVVGSDYTDLVGFEVTPGSSLPVNMWTGQVQVNGDHNTVSGFYIHGTSKGSAVAFANAATGNVLTDFTIADISGTQGVGVCTGATWNALGSTGTTVSHGTITRWGGNAGVYLTGTGCVVDDVTFEGPSGTPGSTDGDGVQVNHSLNCTVRNSTICHIWQNMDASGYHTDCIQAWVDVADLLVDSCKLGTWQLGGGGRGYYVDRPGPNAVIMLGTVQAEQSVEITVQNCLLLGGYTGIAQGNQGTLDVTLLGNTFWCSVIGTYSFDTLTMRDNFFRGWAASSGKAGSMWTSDYNAFFWLEEEPGTYPYTNTIPSVEGSHSLGTTYATRCFAADVFVNPDISAATDYGVNADFSLKLDN